MGSTLVKEIIGILMESSFYFDLNLRERHLLVKHMVLIKGRLDASNLSLQG